MSRRTRFLVVRRDNIGDLVLTTPLIHALRQHHPDAWIGALVNAYNAPVLQGNPDLDAIYAYDKAKHRPEQSRLTVYANTARLLWRLRAARLDHVILAGPGAQRQAWQMVRWLGARSVTGFTTAQFAPRGIRQPVAYGAAAGLHEAADVFRLLAPFGIEGPPPACVLRPDAALAGRLRQTVDGVAGAAGVAGVAAVTGMTGMTGVAGVAGVAGVPGGAGPAGVTAAQRPLVGVHLSARRVKQRWAAARFAELMRALHARAGVRFVLFWSPGAADQPQPPGDDARAREVLAWLPPGVPVVPLPTQRLEQLIAGLSLCDAVVLADGGAMHLAAALGKPLIALFGDAPVARWRPWRVEHEIVQAASGDVADVTVLDVMQAWERLSPRVLTA